MSSESWDPSKFWNRDLRIADERTRETGRLHLSSFDGSEVVECNPSMIFLPKISQRRVSNVPRVILSHKPETPIGCWDISVDGEWIGGLFTRTDGERFGFDAWSAKSAMVLLHKQGFSWDEIREFVGLTIADRSHVQLRHVELIYELTHNMEAAKSFYREIRMAASMLGEELIKNGQNPSAIFLAGGAALLVKPDQFPLQANPMARVRHRLSKPIFKLSTSDLAEAITDVDFLVFGINEPEKVDWSVVLGRKYGNIFSPLGYKPEEVIKNFPDRFGLDLCVFPDTDLATLTNSILYSDELLSDSTLVRYPDGIKHVQIRLAPGLITETFPVWWSPGKEKLKSDYREALLRVRKVGYLPKILEGCSRSSPARKALYAEREVADVLTRRWDMLGEGKFIEDLFHTL